MQDQLAEQAEQAQLQIKALQAKAEKLQLAAEQALAQKREAEQQRKASERVAHNMKQALDARVVRHAPATRAVVRGGSHHLFRQHQTRINRFALSWQRLPCVCCIAPAEAGRLKKR